MVSFPPCKINLGLHVIGKRPDGYHNLETCFYPVPWTDILEVIPASSFSFTSSGKEIPGDPEKNLCIQAYELLKKDFSIPPVKIHLHKIIPTGAGLGGGSSDASHTLRLLNSIFNLSLSVDQLEKYASRLGSDCAFFIHDEPKLGTGRGEELEDISVSLKGKFLVIVKPEVHVSTAEAYAGISPKKPSISIREIFKTIPMEDWKNVLKNDFEESISKKYPVIESIKKQLYTLGATYSIMSGSGSAVVGIFEKPIDLPEEYKTISWSGLIQS
jgi:4-diphosphocytidyl-2-C-methyl-D-erythritol kinase